MTCIDEIKIDVYALRSIKWNNCSIRHSTENAMATEELMIKVLAGVKNYIQRGRETINKIISLIIRDFYINDTSCKGPYIVVPKSKRKKLNETTKVNNS